MRHGSDGCALLQERDVLRPRSELVVRHDGAVGAPAELTVFRRVDELVEAALRHLGRIFEVGEEVFLGAVDELDLAVFPEVDAVDQELEATPRRLHLLEGRVMDDLVDLSRELLVDLGDERVDECLVDLLTFALRRDQLGDERLHAALGDVVALVARSHLGLGENLVEKRVPFE